MGVVYPYRSTIRNEFLGVSKEICGRTYEECDWRARNQLAKWAAQEKKKRLADEARQQVEDLRARAERLTREVQERVRALRDVLRDGLSAEYVFRWSELMDKRSAPPPPVFSFNHRKPDLDCTRQALLGWPPTEDSVRLDFAVPDERPFIEMFLPFLRSRRQRLEEAAAEEFKSLARRYRAGEKRVIEAYNHEVQAYNANRREAKRKFESHLDEFAREKQTLLTEQENHNRAVEEFRARYERAVPESIERVVQMTLDRSIYPEDITGDPETSFDEPSRTLVVNFCLPHTSQIPDIKEYRFVANRKEIRQVEMKKPDFREFYDEIVHQTAIRTIHEVFHGDYLRHIQAVVFNGLVRGIDPKTGKEFTSCILSCQAPRGQFQGFDLARVSAKECIRGLRGRFLGSLAELAPVRPFMTINRDDDRFVEARPVLEQLDPSQNLAAMDWEEFEHLIRDLFERFFAKDGCEVKVTQASRDRGVDAIAFDPEPIRGGKFVIQAKRYNMVVPVSAVRDLYGTMMAERAVKGILVTTSDFGSDSYEFAKDLPITLINGQNLVHMFQEYGHAVHIALAPQGERPGIGRRSESKAN
jgi:restriction system protein